jgi:protein AFG1
MSKFAIHNAYTSLLSRTRLKPNPGQAALIDRLSVLQQTLLDSERPQTGLYIYGSVGTGKSRLADLFAATLSPQISKRRVHFYEFMMDIHSRLHRARSVAGYSGDPLQQIGRDVCNESRVLCFDEFQVSDIADAMILKRLFGSIWESGGVMVSTSNRHPDNLYENGLNRPLFLPFIDELKKRCEVWKLEGNRDYRMSSRDVLGQRDEVFFTNSEAFESFLRSSTAGQAPKPLTIQVMMGRQLQVQAYDQAPNGKALVVAAFKELCERNLGTADYYALCCVASTIYLTSLRQFKADELDFIRRFIALVDLAYEFRIRIVIQSSVPLFEVFAKAMPKEEGTIPASGELSKHLEMVVKKGGGSSSSMMSTFIGDTEWSATGLPASLASGGAGETDVRFAIGRAVSRLFEMGSKNYGVQD